MTEHYLLANFVQSFPAAAPVIEHLVKMVAFVFSRWKFHLLLELTDYVLTVYFCYKIMLRALPRGTLGGFS